MKRFTIVCSALVAAVLLGSAPLAAQQQMPGQPTPQPAVGGPQPPMMGPGMMGQGMMGMMCPMMGMMGGGMMSGPMDRTDPKTMGRMLQMRGEMMKAMGDILQKHGKQMEEGK